MECWICFRGQVDLYSWTSGTFEMEYTITAKVMYTVLVIISSPLYIIS
jgi:hypothetical protein